MQITGIVTNVSTSAITLLAPCNGLVVDKRPSGTEIVASSTPAYYYTDDVLPGGESWTTTRSWKQRRCGTGRSHP